MGGWMPYQRMRSRNGLLFRKPDDDPDPYWRTLAQLDRSEELGWPNVTWAMLVGDMNRMERDYLNPVYPTPPGALRTPGSDPSAECAAATGVDVETVRRVLRYVFTEQP